MVLSGAFTVVIVPHKVVYQMKNTSRRLRGLLLLSLFTCLAASGQVRITEFMASNSHTLADEDGDYSDWIEIQNTATTNVNLLNWYLADKPSNLTKWAFPSTNPAAGNFMIVFASNKNRRTPGKPLHTNFKFSADGEYLALVKPDGVTIATQFSPAFPPQLPDVSYGFGLEAAANLLLTTNATGRVLVHRDGTLGTDWTATGFNDAAWRAATNGIGFETGQSEDPGFVSAVVLADNRAGYWRLGRRAARWPPIPAGLPARATASMSAESPTEWPDRSRLRSTVSSRTISRHDSMAPAQKLRFPTRPT